MAAISRIRTSLTGFVGAPGVTTMYCLDPAPFREALRSWWFNVSSEIPTEVQMFIETSGDILDSVSGELTGTWTAPDLTTVFGGNGATHAGPAGACVNWLTGSVLNGHRLRGRNFLVPLATTSYDTDGGLTAVSLGKLQATSDTLVAAAVSNFVVWHRPVAAAAATATSPARVARAGGHAPVTSSRVANRVAVLRSRRD